MPSSMWQASFNIALLIFHCLGTPVAVEARALAKLEQLNTDVSPAGAGRPHELRSIPANHTLTRRNHEEVPSLQPLIDRDFPDPFLIKGSVHSEADGGGFDYYLFGGHGTQDKVNVQRVDVPIDKDFKSFTQKWDSDSKEALPKVGGWVFASDNVDAYDAHGVISPFVYQPPGSSKFVMYYSAVPKSLAGKRWRCIGIATGDSLTGTFVPDDNVWVCPEQEGGASYPSVFYDTSTKRTYIIYKIDAEAKHTGGGKPDVQVVAQEVRNDDARTKIGSAFKIFASGTDKKWIAASNFNTLESPQVTLKDNRYSLTYSIGPLSHSKQHEMRHAYAWNFSNSGQVFKSQVGAVVGPRYIQSAYMDNTNNALSNWDGTRAPHIEPEQYIVIFNVPSQEDPSLRFLSAATLEMDGYTSTEDSDLGFWRGELGVRQSIGPLKIVPA